MMDWLRKNMRYIFLITIIGFFAGMFVGFGSYFFSGKSTNAVAVVNGTTIPLRKYSLLYNRIMEDMRDKNTDITEEVVNKTRQEVVDDLIREEVSYGETKKHGIVVTNSEVAANIAQIPAFQQEGRFDQRAYFQVLAYRLKMTPMEFEESQKRQIAIAKMRNIIASGVRITEPELQLEYMRRHAGNMKVFEKDREKFSQELLQEKSLAYMNDWYKSINTSLKIKVYTENFK
ncbi:MAG: SurA N-terminal domain-containing protein [Elusimicrobiota bacterium]